MTVGFDALRFEQPGYLALLAVLPLMVALSLRSLSGLAGARRWIAIGLRTLVIMLMIFALAGMQRVRRSDALSVIFLVDRSHSVPPREQKQAFDFIKAAQEAIRPAKDRLGIVAFDGQPAIEQLPMATLGITAIGGPALPDQTNLAAAMRMGMALFKEDAARRLVLLSDGNENVGQAREEAEQLAAAGVPIDVLPLQYQHTDEVVFERLISPAHAAEDETVNLQMVLRAQKPASGRVLLYHNDVLLDLNGAAPGAGYPVVLAAGPNRFTMPVPLRAAGAHRFRAVFEPDSGVGDTIAANNEGQAFTVVGSGNRVLILTTESESESAEILRRALGSQQLQAEVEIAGARPLDQARLLEFSLVILSNVPASYVSEEAQNALAAYVRDLGGGLAMIGGDESFGAGGWMSSPIEDVMPVSFDVKSKKQIPKGALVLVMHASEIPQGNYWGERVAVAAVKTLSSRDLAGVLAYRWQGAEQGYWVAPLQEVGSKTGIIQQIMRMDMGDLGDFEQVVRPGVDALVARRDAAARHMIIISDFDPAAPSAATIQLMKANGITCSTVAIGYGGHPIDELKAKQIADQTGGKFYTTSDYSQLPQIFIKESQIVRRSLINETPFVPQLSGSLSQLVAGLEGGVPELGGYVVTTAKQLANVPLIRQTEDGADPVLAHWHVGLGKTVAFSSGMWNRWGSTWAVWPGFPKLWGQIARWAARPSSESRFDVNSWVQGGKGHIRIDALDQGAAAIDFLNIEGRLVTPGPRYEARPLELRQTGPGRYEADFDARDPGSYIVNLVYSSGSGRDAASGSLQTGVTVSYSPEFRDLQANEPLLNEIAAISKGRVLARGDARATFDLSGLQPAESRKSIWEDLVRWMLVLFLLDVAVRRVAISPIELARKLRRYIGEIAGGRRKAEESAAVLTSLRETRERLREGFGAPSRPSDAGPAPDRAARYEAPQTESQATRDLTETLGGAKPEEAPVVAKPGKKPAPTSESDYTSRLLRAKKKARGESEPPQAGP